MIGSKNRLACTLAGVLALAAAPAWGATVTYSSSVSGGIGNEYTRNATDGTSVAASAWSLKGSTWEQGQLKGFSRGLGVCNASEEGINCGPVRLSV